MERQYAKLENESCVVLSKVTYINIVNVQDLRVELKSHGFGLLNWVCQLAVRLHTQYGEKDDNIMNKHFMMTNITNINQGITVLCEQSNYCLHMSIIKRSL